MPPAFRVGLSHDLYSSSAQTSWGDIELASLEDAGVSWEFLPADDGTLSAAAVTGYDAILFAAPGVTAETVSGPSTPQLFARFGVGLDSVDLPACSAAGAAVTITPDGAKRAVATAALALILAVEHRLIDKHRLVEQGRWQDKQQLMGRGLTGKTVGTIGLGNVALELFGLLAPFYTVNLASDPRRRLSGVITDGVELVDLPDVLARCDILVITAALTDETRHLIGAQALSSMKSDAILVNVARGPIVDTDALVRALAAGELAGAGLDVFESEPLPSDHPLIGMENVVLSPHALAWTEEMARGNGASAIRSILAVRDRVRPTYLANPDVLGHERFRDFRLP
ncbi:phosphoglycerate dehydrogenase-like enzyme [Nakamurella sp. UYEF19]|uniref:NAD(P)-dependent oxidoreductase n=1 Tax=Nakamurella sp. UYEF19 TaxID=1756392 RepID=UPI00339925DF